MHFKREGPNTAMTRPDDRLWRLRTQMTYLGSSTKLQNGETTNFAPKTHNGDQTFSMGLSLAKYLTHDIYH